MRMRPSQTYHFYQKNVLKKPMIDNLKCVFEPLIKSYEQFNFSQNSEIRRFKRGIPREKRLRKFITRKASQSLKNISIFQKKCNQKSMISASKTKNTHSVQKCPQNVSRSF